MAENLFEKLNKQRIPDDVRAALLNGTPFEVVGDQIRIGEATFPYDLFHVMEVFNILENETRDVEQRQAKLNHERLLWLVDGFKRALDLAIEELHQLPEGPEREDYAKLINQMLEDVRKLFS